MTRTERSTNRRRRTVATALVGATAALALMAPSTASAYSRVASADVATLAGDAVTALERWESSGSTVDYARFVQLRSRAASVVAGELGVSGVALRTAWAGVRIEKQHAMLAAISQVGVPYRSMRSEEGEGFDCSGLLLYAFNRAGVDLPRSSGDQIREADEIEGAEAEPGDLVYYPGHISMYVGGGLLVHSPYTGSEVEIRLVFDKSLRYGDLFDADVVMLPDPAATGAAAHDGESATAI
jgi:cell wall-associated NlpC family hydrolase